MLWTENVQVFIECNLIAQHNIDVVLQPFAVPFDCQHNVSFKQYHASARVARITMPFLHQNHVDVIYWLPYSDEISTQNFNQNF